MQTVGNRKKKFFSVISEISHFSYVHFSENAQCFTGEFLYRYLKQLFCNALTQPHFHYACSAWYLNLNKKFKNKLQTIQKKCIKCCLQLDNRSHIGNVQYAPPPHPPPLWAGGIGPPFKFWKRGTWQYLNF